MFLDGPKKILKNSLVAAYVADYGRGGAWIGVRLRRYETPGGRVSQSSPVGIQVVLFDGSIYPQKGRLNFAATAIDSRLGTQQLRAEFDNPRQQLLPGGFVTVRITAGQRDNVFVVPQAAVIQTEKEYLVFAINPEGKAVAKPVKPGDWVGSDWTILSGLAAGDRVIVDNLLKIRPGVAVSEAPPASSPAK